jgi:hypothetical protein
LLKSGCSCSDLFIESLSKKGTPLSYYRVELPRHAAGVLAPGELLLASARAMPVGPFGGSMGVFAGAAMGAVIQSIAISRSVKRAALSRFPLAGRMVVAISDRRILIWRMGGLLGGTITTLLGHVPLSRIARVELESVPGRSKLMFVLRDAPVVTIEADKRDAPDRFVEAFRQSVGGVPVGQAPSEANVRPGPEAAPLGAPTLERPSAPVGSWTQPRPRTRSSTAPAIRGEGEAGILRERKTPPEKPHPLSSAPSVTASPAEERSSPGPSSAPMA